MSDTLNPQARAFLQSVQHDDDPTSADYERVRARLRAELALGVAASAVALAMAKTGAATTEAAAPATSAVTTGAGVALMSKIGAAVLVAGVVAGGAAAVARYVHRAERVSAVATPTSGAAPMEAAGTLAGTSAASPTSTYEPRRDAPAAPVRQRSITARPRATVPPAVERPSLLDGEIALLRAAHTARRGGEPARALAILHEHETRFPHGALSEDCAAERIYALCALGRADEARLLATRFMAAHPASPHAPAVRSSCGFTAPQ
jgi:hypothetical protein